MSFHSWLATSLIRHYPQTPAQPDAHLTIDAALNERVSFQVAMRLEDAERHPVRVTAEGPAGWSVRVRRVGYVPVRHLNTPIDSDSDGIGHIPGYVPDPLFDEDTLLLPNGETHAFWITVQPGENASGASAAPGDYEIRVSVIPEGAATFRHTATVRLHDVVLQPRRNFNVTHWFYADALIDWYKTDLFDERFWQILPNYIRDMVAHGQDTLYVPVFTPSLDGVKRPSQLLGVTRTAPDTYQFNWTDVKRYIDLAKQCGITNFEWSHFFTQWGAKNAIRIYDGQGRDEQLLWAPETGATDEAYRTFLWQYLPKLHRFLEVEGVVKQSFFHVSDEPHAEHLPQYQDDRDMLQEFAPWMQVMDALSDIAFGRQQVTDMPIPSIRTALDFIDEDIPSWCYYCCGPRGQYLQHLLDTPLPKIAMHGFLFYRWAFKGFLHWGYNYWYASQTRTLIDPYSEQDGRRWNRGWAYGDPFYVYPGPDGPIDSLRWEIFAESMQDYRLLQTLGIPRDDVRLADIRTFADFPKSADWRLATRKALLSA